MIRTELRFQSPRTDAGSLRSILVASSQGATSGGGIFAWTNRAGVVGLLDDPDFRSFTETAPFDLVVGLDSITDASAIRLLQDRAAARSKLALAAFLHDREGLFHPKLAWFERPDGLVLVVGSGNLTGGGLGKNWEAHFVSTLNGADADAVRKSIWDWKGVWRDCLVPLSDPRVAERAKQNAGSERKLKQAQRAAAATLVIDRTQAVLVSEFTSSNTKGGRVRQANFPRGIYEGFFGMRLGVAGYITVWHVESDGKLRPSERAKGVQVRSHNYRFELGALPPVQPSGRLFGVFLRLAPKEFLYRVLKPGDGAYALIDQFLDERWAPRGNRLRRVQTTTADLQEAWPDAPFWNAPLP